MRVDIEDVYELENELKRINSIDLLDMELYRDGKRIQISQDKIDNWIFTGLNNFYFIIDEVWVEESDEEDQES